MGSLDVGKLEKESKKTTNIYNARLATRLLFILGYKAVGEGVASYKKGNYKQSIVFFRISKRLTKGTYYYLLTLYNMARAYSKTLQKKKAIKTLEEALKGGFDNIRKLKTDEDLDNIRDLNAFKDMIKHLERRKK